ncbi:hypothetical protein Q7Y45_03200 [Glaesserella parasuis]|nr:hypothetical protein [Glaesserella parasuis]
MFVSLLSFIFSLIGFAIFAYVGVAFSPWFWGVLFVWLAYRVIKWDKHRRQQKLQPNHQNGGKMPLGVTEDKTESHLSFQPKH